MQEKRRAVSTAGDPHTRLYLCQVVVAPVDIVLVHLVAAALASDVGGVLAVEEGASRLAKGRVLGGVGEFMIVGKPVQQRLVI